MDKKFWKPVLDWMDNTLIKNYQTISPGDKKLFHVCDTAEEAMKYIRKSKERTIF